MMRSRKMLHIRECFFNLPDNFNGTLADALMLMANRAAQAEAYNEMYEYRCRKDVNLSECLVSEDNIKCTIEWEFI